jgi:hypothetical protein
VRLLDDLCANPHRIAPPSGFVLKLNPIVAGNLAQMGYDPEHYRTTLNETTRRRLEREALAEGVDAIDGEDDVVT